MKAGVKRQVQLGTKPTATRMSTWWPRKNLVLLPLCFEIPNVLKMTKFASNIQEMGSYLVFKRFTQLFVQKKSSPWRRGKAPTQEEVHRFILALQTLGLDGHCIRNHPEDYNEISSVEAQHPAGPAVQH